MKKVSEVCFLTRYPEYVQRLNNQFALMEEGCEVFSIDKDFTIGSLYQKGFKLFIVADDAITFYDGDQSDCLRLEFSTMDCICSLDKKEIAGKTIYVAAENTKEIDFKVLREYFATEVLSYTSYESRESENLTYTNNKINSIYLAAPVAFEGIKNAKLEYQCLFYSTETLYKVIEAAKCVLDTKHIEFEKNKENVLRMEQYKVVFNFTNDAILATDENGIIIAANNMVYKFLCLDPKDKLEGKRIDKVVKGTKMIKAMEKEKGDIGDVFELPYCTVLTHRIPIEIDGKRKGVVSTFQDLIALQEHEKNARVNFYKNKKGFSAKYSFDDIKGSGFKIQEVKNIAKSYANSNSTVLILGETGTGKELFAQSIHNASLRQDGPFVAINCAAIPKNLLEAEFFGYEEGSFTGASKGGKMGVFEMAHKGTIFLDEIGEMPLDMQAQLLRVIQEKEIRRIGSDKVVPVEVRVISATNRDLRGDVEKGRFREDLFYRLNVLELKILPLRERREDIREISFEYLRSFNYKGFKSNEALWERLVEELGKYEMRGNIRELQNMLERLSVMLENKHITTTALFGEINKGMTSREGLLQRTKPVVTQMKYEDVDFGRSEADLWEKKKILSALKNNDFSRTKTAQELGISRSTLWNKMKYHKIEV